MGGGYFGLVQCDDSSFLPPLIWMQWNVIFYWSFLFLQKHQISIHSENMGEIDVSWRGCTGGGGVIAPVLVTCELGPVYL